MPRPKRITPCATCAKPFQMRKDTSKYCSRACRNANKILSLDALLWPRVERTDTCWLFCGIVTKDGYGRVVSQVNKKRRMLRAHRIAWTLASGVEPTDDQKVCHTCDIPLCVRNDEPGIYVVKGIAYPRFGHLFLGTAAANSQDRNDKGRAPTSFAIRPSPRYAFGESAGHAKLTEAQVREIRARKAQGETYAALGADFGMTPASLWDVVHRKTWAHVD